MLPKRSQRLKSVLDDEDFKNIFTKYWDNIIIGIVAGLVVYYGIKISNGLVSALMIFIFAIILTFIYSLFVLIDKKYKMDNKFWNFLKRYKIHITLIIVGALIYSKLHELVHSFIATKLGYINSINWNSLIPLVHLDLENMSLNHYFLIAMAPYLLNIMLLLILFFLYIFIKKKIIFYLAIIPFLDTFTNVIAIPLALITNKSNDFLNLFKLGNYYETILVAISPIIIFLIINYFRRKNATK